MAIGTDELSKNAMGGTELMKQRLVSLIDPSLLDKFQIHFSRIREVDNSKIQIFYAHDLPEDPESAWIKTNLEYTKNCYFVFVSNWQLQQYHDKLQVPYSRSFVIPNAIELIEPHPKPDDGKIKLIYTSTPHRGLGILYYAFNELVKRHNIELDVFSSFKLYGWEERDKPFQQLFSLLKEHPNINYHGTQSNDVIRDYLQKAHIFAYPSIWKETSCLCLIEAMSAGCVCVHPNYGALPETAVNSTVMYNYTENIDEHVNRFIHALEHVIGNYKNYSQYLFGPTQVAASYHSVNLYKQNWTNLLSGLVKHEITTN